MKINSKHAKLFFYGILAAGTLGAQAEASVINCYKNLPAGSQWANAANDPYGKTNKQYIYTFDLLSSSPTFNVSQTLVSQNQLNYAITATFTSSQSETFTSTVSSTFAISFFKWLTASVSASFAQSVTTQIGQTDTVSVPAMSSVVGEYGVDAYDLTYNVRTLMKAGAVYNNGTLVVPETCYDLGTESRTSNVPTKTIRWRFSPG